MPKIHQSVQVCLAEKQIEKLKVDQSTQKFGARVKEKMDKKVQVGT